jgi:hypothetical protein
MLADGLSAPVATVLSALIAAFIGGFLGHLLTQIRERRKARFEAAVRHLERQLEELYGPLYGLVRESQAIYEVACEILPTSGDSVKRIDVGKFQGGDIIKWRFLIEQYWFPLNREIIKLLRTRVHLLEDGKMPDSFEAFLKHAAGFEALHRLWQEKGEETHKEVKGIGWPPGFSADVSASLTRLIDRYESCLDRLGGSPRLKNGR